MRLGQSDLKWSALNTSVNNPQDKFRTHPLKPLAKVIRDAFNHMIFVA